jgi:hypothetical protein
MKKITFLLILGFLAYRTQAQQNAGLQAFKDFCTQCENGTKDYSKSNCRGTMSVCDVIADAKGVAIKKSDQAIQNVIFAYKNTDELHYGFTAKMEVMNKKGEILFSTMDAAMYYLNSEGNLGKITSTTIESFETRKIESQQSVLFNFTTDIKIPADAQKLKVKTTIYRIDLSNRELVEVKSETTTVK